MDLFIVFDLFVDLFIKFERSEELIQSVYCTNRTNIKYGKYILIIQPLIITQTLGRD